MMCMMQRLNEMAFSQTLPVRFVRQVIPCPRKVQNLLKTRSHQNRQTRLEVMQGIDDRGSFRCHLIGPYEM